MPTKSKSQAIAARIALAAKKGKISTSKLKGASKQMYKMTVKQLEGFAGTPRKHLPAKKRSKKE